MIRKSAELKRETWANRFGGKGEVEGTQLIDLDQFQGKGRLFGHNKIRPGGSIGWHQHKGDFEVYYVLKGQGIVDDNGAKVPVGPGDVVYTNAGEFHSLENTGAEDLEVIALVLFV